LKKINIFYYSLIACAITPLLFWISSAKTNFTRGAVPQNKPFVRESDKLDFSAVSFTGWDFEGVAANIAPRKTKPYTLMIFMNGSDLESENGAATDDIKEILDTSVDSQAMNLIILTGGANRWQNTIVPDNECMIWEVTGDSINGLSGIGLLNMGDAGTLADFINLGYRAFPAEKYGLIMWDHGGGSIAGYGLDEKFENNNLTLLEMNYAFARSEAAYKKLEFLAFDSCLMASAEMAVVASDYANYLIASEDLEPGLGWDYSFIKELNKNPDSTGDVVGRYVIDKFMQYYSRYSDEILTMSVTDLSRVGHVMSAMGDLMDKCDSQLPTEFKTFAVKRGDTKTFGEGSPRDNNCDMVDLSDMARKLSDIYPDEAQTLLNALDYAVVYNRHNSDVNLGGLSGYYIYGGRDIGDFTLAMYDKMLMDTAYTAYNRTFYRHLSGGRAMNRSAIKVASDESKTDQTAWKKDGDKYVLIGVRSEDYPTNKWPKIGGEYVAMYRVDGLRRKSLYAVPAKLNDRDCDIMIMMDSKNTKILGARQNDGLIIQKGNDPIKKGDTLSFYYKKRDFEKDTENWITGVEMIVSDALKFEWEELEPDFYTCNQLTDIYGLVTYSELSRHTPAA
jgi:hypothetical protein